MRAATGSAVAVIIPVYNGREFLPATVASVLSQRLPSGVSMLVIAVDDASTDGSGDWLERLASELAELEVVVSRLSKNEGRAVARNRGLTIARARGCAWVSFLDQDDLWPCDSLRLRLDVLENRSTELVQGRQEFFLMPGCERPSWCRPEWLSESQAGMVLGASLMRMTLFDRVGTFEPELRHGGDDADWFMRVRRAGVEVENLRSTTLVRRVHQDNGSSDTRGRQELAAIVRGHLLAARNLAPPKEPVD